MTDPDSWEGSVPWSGWRARLLAAGKSLLAMALLAQALTTVNDVLAYTGQTLVAEELVSVYHDTSVSATAATTQVTSGTLSLVITGGANAGTDNIVLSTQADVAALVTTINALANGWVALAVPGRATADPTSLDDSAVSSAFGIAAVQYLAGQNSAQIIEAINAATEMIELYTGRRFKQTTYNHLYSGSGRKTLKLLHWPVIDILRVSLGKRGALRVKNTVTDAQDAYAQVTPTSVVLDIQGGAEDGTDTVAYTSTDSLTTVIALINALAAAKKWEAELHGDADGAWLMAEVYETGKIQCLDFFADFNTQEESLAGFDAQKDAGILYRTTTGGRLAVTGLRSFQGGSFTPIELRPLTPASVGPFWPQGTFNIYVRYSAGFATIPAEVKFEANRVASNILRGSTRDTALQSESVDGYSYSAGDGSPMPQNIKDRLFGHKTMWRPPFVEV